MRAFGTNVPHNSPGSRKLFIASASTFLITKFKAFVQTEIVFTLYYYPNVYDLKNGMVCYTIVPCYSAELRYG